MQLKAARFVDYELDVVYDFVDAVFAHVVGVGAKLRKSAYCRDVAYDVIDVFAAVILL